MRLAARLKPCYESHRIPRGKQVKKLALGGRLRSKGGTMRTEAIIIYQQAPPLISFQRVRVLIFSHIDNLIQLHDQIIDGLLNEVPEWLGLNGLFLVAWIYLSGTP
jgi:hypothetical protein